MNSQSEKIVWKRNKTITVLLAVFLGPWTWLYTYQRDPGKAAFGLGLNISLVIVFTLMVIQSKMSPPPPGSNAGEALVYSGISFLQFLFATWVAAIIFSAVSKEYYLDKPKGRAKAVAIVCAIFLGPWTWLYTYKKDYWKFWPSIFIGLGGWVAWALLPEATSDIVHSFWLPTCLVIWIVSMITAISRKGEWYKMFGGSFSEAFEIQHGN